MCFQSIYSQCGNGDYPLIQNQNSGIPDGDRYINLVIHVVCYNDCTGGINEAEVGVVIDKLNIAYNPRGIYFKVNCILQY